MPRTTSISISALLPALLGFTLLGGLTCGCSGEPVRHANAGLQVIAEIPPASIVPTDGQSAARAKEEAEAFAALEAVLAHEPAELRTYIEPGLSLQTMLDDPARAFGRVFAVRGGLKQFWPKRDSVHLPEGIDETWTGFVFDQRGSHQPYRILFAGTPSTEAGLEDERVVVVGVFVHQFRYEDRAGREHVAPVLVTRDIRQLRMD